MASRKNKILWFSASTLIIGVMVYFADIGRFIKAVTTAKTTFLVPAFVLGLSVFLTWAYPWYGFLNRMGYDISYWQALKMFMAGNFLNSITPLGQFGGEPFMAYIISRNSDATKEEAFSAVLSADIVNAIPTFTFIMGGTVFLLVFGKNLNQVIIDTIFLVGLTTVVGGAFVYLLWFETGRIEKGILKILETLAGVTGRGNSIVARARNSLKKAEESFAAVGESPRHLLKVSMVSHLGFVLNLSCLYFLLLSVGITSNFTHLYFVMTLSFLGTFSPTPGGAGTFEALMATLLTTFLPIQFASALVVAILFRLTTYWPGLLIGYVSINALENGGGK